MRYIWLLSVILAGTITSSAQNFRKMRECVVVNGQLKEVEIDYNPATGERTMLVNGVRKDFYEVYPMKGVDYADGLGWFINNEKVQFNGKTFTKYGLPRILGVNEIVKSGLYKGVGVYVEAGLKPPFEVIYIPVRQGCEFQPYQLYCGEVTIEKIATTKTTMQLKATTTGVAGTPTFSWTASGVKIIKGQGTRIITVDIRNKKEDDYFEVSLKVNAKGCPVYTREDVVVKRN